MLSMWGAPSDRDYYDQSGFLDDEEEIECCPNCGKEYEDFSDMGCEKCDRRHPDYGVLP